MAATPNHAGQNLLPRRTWRMFFIWAPFGRKFYYDCGNVHWGRIYQIGLWPFVLFVNRIDDYDLATGKMGTPNLSPEAQADLKEIS